MLHTPKPSVDNSIYDRYGDRWYTADDDPIALLRAESSTILEWLKPKLTPGISILDVGCGAGFLSNPLSALGYKVSGLDISAQSLAAARRHDQGGRVEYIAGDAYRLPFANESFDAVTCMDFLEHVAEPEKVVREISRVLKPGGCFYFHTFNRNPLAHLVVIKLVEWLVKNTPKNMHVIHLFIKPRELRQYCELAGISVKAFTGIGPDLLTVPLKNLFTGTVPRSLRFKLTKSTLLSYLGEASKN